MNLINNILSEEMVYALGWTVLHAMWQGLLIAALLAIVLFFLQKKSARIRYEVACLSLFLLFITSLSTFLILLNEIQTVESISIIIGDFGPSNMSQSSIKISSTYFSFFEHLNQYLSLIVGLWLSGMFFFMIRIIGGLFYANELKKTDVIIASLFWHEKLNQLKQKLNLNKTIQLLESSRIKVPMTIGYLKPAILLPIGTINSLNPTEVEAIIAHELAHIFRNDYLLNILLSFIEVLYYYHPAIWWIASNIRREREHCCDDLAVELSGGSLNYVKALVRIQQYQSNNTPIMAMAMNGRKNQLLNRVKRILKQSENKSNHMEKFTATCLLLTAFIFFSFTFKDVNAKETKAINTTLKTEEELNALLNDTCLEHNDIISRDETNLSNKLNTETLSLNNIEKKINEVLSYSNDIQNELSNISSPLITSADTTKESFRFITSDYNGNSILLEMKDGEIENLKIDGKSIPSNRYEEYDDIVNDIIVSTTTPPTPPTPASIGTNPPVPPTPPTPPNFGSGKQSLKINRSKVNGKNKVTIKNSSVDMTIEIDGEDVLINGEKMEDSDQEIHIINDDEYYLEEEIALMEEWAEEQREIMEDYEEVLSDFADEHGEINHLELEKVMKIQEEKMKQHEAELKRFNHFSEDSKHSMKDDIEEAKRILEEHKTELKREMESIRKNITLGMEEQSFSDQLVNALIQDGFIKKEAKKYKIRFNYNWIKVNRKTLSEDFHKKYVELYEEVHGMKMKKDSNIVIRKY